MKIKDNVDTIVPTSTNGTSALPNKDITSNLEPDTGDGDQFNCEDIAENIVVRQMESESLVL